MKHDIDDPLLALDRRGLIPGPEESLVHFEERVHLCLSLDKNFDFEGQGASPANASLILEGTTPVTESLYGIRPEWIQMIFSNKKLAPWHGGCAWIVQSEENASPVAFLQLRKAFYRSSQYLHLYHRRELITHELAHIGRMTFEEPKFEEILAYRSSPSSFRRYFGPIIQSTKEVFVFFVVLLLTLLLNIAFIDHFPWILLSQLAPIGLVALACGRLWVRQSQFRRCLVHLRDLVNDKQRANAIIYRLTDKEIQLFATLSAHDIKMYAEKEAQHSFRWRVILKNWIS